MSNSVRPHRQQPPRLPHPWDSPGKNDQPWQHIKKQRHHFTNIKVTALPSSQNYGFSSSHVWMWELDHKESWVPKNWRFIVVLEKTLESPLDRKEIKLVNPIGNQLNIFIGRTDAETEVPIIWPPDAKSWFTGKDADSGKDWRQEKKIEPWQRMRWLDSFTDSMDMNLNRLGETVRIEEPGVLQSMGSQPVGRDLVTAQQSIILEPFSLLLWVYPCT